MALVISWPFQCWPVMVLSVLDLVTTGFCFVFEENHLVVSGARFIFSLELFAKIINIYIYTHWSDPTFQNCQGKLVKKILKIVITRHNNWESLAPRCKMRNADMDPDRIGMDYCTSCGVWVCPSEKKQFFLPPPQLIFWHEISPLDWIMVIWAIFFAPGPSGGSGGLMWGLGGLRKPNLPISTWDHFWPWDVIFWT